MVRMQSKNKKQSSSKKAKAKKTTKSVDKKKTVSVKKIVKSAVKKAAKKVTSKLSKGKKKTSVKKTNKKSKPVKAKSKSKSKSMNPVCEQKGYDAQVKANQMIFLGNKKSAKKSKSLKSKSLKKASKKKDSKPSTTFDPTTQYLNEIGFHPLLTAKDEIRLGRRVVKGDEAAFHTMVESNLRLVVKISKFYSRSHMQLSDLIEEGNIGLMTAVRKFDPERGFRFSTYATWWIRQTIERAIMNQERTVRLPVHISKELNSFMKVVGMLVKKKGRAPHAEEIADIWKRPIKDVYAMMALPIYENSIDRQISDSDTRHVIEQFKDESAEDPLDTVIKSDLKDNIVNWLSQLSYKHRVVIVRRYGLMGYPVSTLKDVGQAVGLTRERVRQLQLEAIEQLKVIISSDDVDE